MEEGAAEGSGLYLVQEVVEEHIRREDTSTQR